jgi:hypothetical protein
MKANNVSVLILAALAGCAANVPTDEAPVQKSAAEALTLAECATQRDTCFQNNPLFGLFTCPLQYAQCQATASNGIPAAVTSAIKDTRACAATANTCLQAAKSAADRLTCRQKEADCIAGVVEARLPPIVTGTAMCIDDSVTCVASSETTQNLADCADTLRNCAVAQVVAALPPEVGTVVTNINDCTSSLRACTDEATAPSDLTQCTQDEVSCVGNALGVPIPQAPIADAQRCAEGAVDCTIDARSASDLRACTADLTMCNANIAKQQLTCAQQWTRCLAQNPLGFLGCAIQLANCTD